MSGKKEEIKQKFDKIVDKINIDSNVGNDVLDGMTENEKRTFCAEAHSLANNKFFNKLCDFYINKHILDLAISAKDMEEIFAERAKIVGVAELRNNVIFLDNLHNAENQPQEEFDSKEVL